MISTESTSCPRRGPVDSEDVAVVLIPKMASHEAFPHYRFPNFQFPIESKAIAKPLIPDSRLGPRIMRNLIPDSQLGPKIMQNH